MFFQSMSSNSKKGQTSIQESNPDVESAARPRPPRRSSPPSTSPGTSPRRKNKKTSDKVIYYFTTNIFSWVRWIVFGNK